MTGKNTRFPRRLWRFFGSLRVLFWLLAATALVSLAGVFILQQGPLWAYIELYGEGWTKVILALGVDDLFHTPYFIALLAWLTVSLVVCSLRRLRSRHNDETPNGVFQPQQTLTLTGDSSRFLSLTSARLKGRNWRVKREDDSLYAERGHWAWWASSALHLGAALLVLAGALKLIGGRSATMVLFEDQPQLAPPEMGAELEIVSPDFGTLTDPNSGRVLSFYTELEVRSLTDDVEEGHHLEVNVPYRRDGLACYQSFVDELQPVVLFHGPTGELAEYVEQLHAYQRSQAYPLAVELRLDPLIASPPEQLPPSVEQPVALPVPEDVPLEETVSPAMEDDSEGYVAEEPPTESLPRTTEQSRTVRVTLDEGPATLPGGYSVEVLDFEPAASLDDGSAAPAAVLRLSRDGEVVVDGGRVFGRRFGASDPRLDACGYRLSLGRVVYTSTPLPDLPASIRQYKLYGGETGGEGTWLALDENEPVYVAFAVQRGLVLRRGLQGGEEWALPASLDADPSAVIEIAEGTAVAYHLGEAESISGLELKRDPGLWLFWPGVILLTLGSILFVAVPYRSLWLRLDENRVHVRCSHLPEGRLRRLLSPEGGGPK